MAAAGQGFDGSTGACPGWNWAFIGSAVEHALLPAFTIVLTSVAGWMLQMRNVMITTIGEDYVVAAQAKGLSKTRIIYTYAARNALLPQLQGFGLALGFVVSGALVMEIVFSYPGIGLQPGPRGAGQGLPADAGDLPGDHLRGAGRQLRRRPGHRVLRPACPRPGGSVMSIWRNLPLKAKIGVVLFGVFLLAAIIGPMVEPYDPGFASLNPALSLNHPSAQHLLGTTQTGQDVLSQVLTGIRLTMIVALIGRCDRHRPRR